MNIIKFICLFVLLFLASVSLTNAKIAGTPACTSESQKCNSKLPACCKDLECKNDKCTKIPACRTKGQQCGLTLGGTLLPNCCKDLECKFGTCNPIKRLF